MRTCRASCAERLGRNPKLHGPTRYVAKSLAEAERTRALLGAALREGEHDELAGRLKVRPVLAFVGARVIGAPRAGTVLIATAGNLTHLLRSCPAQLDDAEIKRLYQIARWSSMWTTPRHTERPRHPQVLEWPRSSLIGISELNNVPFVLKGWEDISRWGFELDYFYAQLTHNGRSDDDSPEFWITPGGSQPVVTNAHELARRISSCTGVGLDIVLQAMRSPLSEAARLAIGLLEPR